MKATGAGIIAIGTEIAYRMIFEEQLHQNRRLGTCIYANEYCSKETFMRIMKTLIRYQLAEIGLAKRDLIPNFMKTFIDCTRRIIGLYSTVQQ